MNLKKISLLAAGFMLAGWFQTMPARADDYCSRLEVSVRPLPGYFHSSQPVEVRTRVRPGPGVDSDRYSTAVIEIELELQGRNSMGSEPAQLRHHAKWGTFSKSNIVYASEPISAIRVVNASCWGVTVM